MGTKIMKQKETETVFDRRNYVILLIGSVMIIVGYLFMRRCVKMKCPPKVGR